MEKNSHKNSVKVFKAYKKLYLYVNKDWGELRATKSIYASEEPQRLINVSIQLWFLQHEVVTKSVAAPSHPLG